MKHKVIVATCLVAIVVVGVLSVQAYNRYRHTSSAAAAAVAQAEQKAAQVKASAEATFNAKVHNLEAICQKALVAYESLPTYQKAKSQAPDCSL